MYSTYTCELEWHIDGKSDETQWGKDVVEGEEVGVHPEHSQSKFTRYVTEFYTLITSWSKYTPWTQSEQVYLIYYWILHFNHCLK